MKNSRMRCKKFANCPNAAPCRERKNPRSARGIFISTYAACMIMITHAIATARNAAGNKPKDLKVMRNMDYFVGCADSPALYVL
jgi:hypothetical protein